MLPRISRTDRQPTLKPAGYLRGILRTLRRRPSLLIPALVVWVMCTVAIIVAVVLSADTTEQVERDKAKLLVTSVATARCLDALSLRSAHPFGLWTPRGWTARVVLQLVYRRASVGRLAGSRL